MTDQAVRRMKCGAYEIEFAQDMYTMDADAAISFERASGGVSNLLAFVDHVNAGRWDDMSDRLSRFADRCVAAGVLDEGQKRELAELDPVRDSHQILRVLFRSNR